MIIPTQELPEDTLNNIISEYVMMSGTDYGAIELSHETKCNNLKEKLLNRVYVVVYSEHHLSLNILPADQFPSAKHKPAT